MFADSGAAEMRLLRAGSEREAQLYGNLAALGVAFFTEEDLRDRGFFKTPDARLRVRAPRLLVLHGCALTR